MSLPTQELARVALRSAVESLRQTWSDQSLLVQYDDLREVNTPQDNLPYLQVDLVYQDGMQMSLGKHSGFRGAGTIVLEAWRKEGTSRKAAILLLSHFYLPLQASDAFPPLRTYAAKLVTGKTNAGWVPEAALIPFWHDTLPE